MALSFPLHSTILQTSPTSMHYAEVILHDAALQTNFMIRPAIHLF